MKYRRIIETNGRWSDWIAPRRRGYKMACCDCGLVHDLQFQMAGKQIQFRASKNNRSTAAMRRHMKGK